MIELQASWPRQLSRSKKKVWTTYQLEKRVLKVAEDMEVAEGSHQNVAEGTKREAMDFILGAISVKDAW